MSNTPSPMQNGAADHAIAGVAEPNWAALRHSANEWADMAINGLQWLRNIVDGASDAKSALENMEGNLAHCRAVNDAPDVQFAIRAASAAVPATHAGQPVSSFDHKTASAILANRPVCGDALRRFVATARWEHDARHGMSLMIADLRRELGVREAEIALLKEALLLAEGVKPACGEEIAQERPRVTRQPVADNQAYAAWLAFERIAYGQGAEVDQEALGVLREYFMRAAPAPAPAPQEIAPAIPGIRGPRPFSRANAQTSSYTGQGPEREAGK